MSYKENQAEVDTLKGGGEVPLKFEPNTGINGIQLSSVTGINEAGQGPFGDSGTWVVWKGKTFDPSTPEYVTAEFTMPDDYEEGEDFDVEFIWLANENGKNVRWQCGVGRGGDGIATGLMDTVWETPKVVAQPGTSLDGEKTIFTIDGTNYLRGDSCIVNIFRDPAGTGDDATVDAIIGWARITHPIG